MILFVCSQAFLRSRTAEILCLLGGIEARCAGTDDNAFYPINDRLIESASTIVFMSEEHRQKVRKNPEFVAKEHFVLNIPDDYERFDPVLARLLIDKMKGLKPDVGDALELGYTRYLTALATGLKPVASAWMDVPFEDHCSMRILLGADPEDIGKRVAFIEKTPRVRVAPYSDFATDSANWEQGSKGSAPEYGQNQPSRDWCDQRLVELGYALLP